MLRDLMWFAVVIMSINATMAVISANIDPDNSFAGNVFTGRGALQFIPEGQRNLSPDQNWFDLNASILDTNIAQPNTTFPGIIDIVGGFLSGLARSISIILGTEAIFNLVISLINWAVAFSGIMLLLVAGTFIILTEAGLPSYIVFLFGVPTTIINAAGLFILLEHLFAMIRGATI
jgi:hypothetical protein